MIKHLALALLLMASAAHAEIYTWKSGGTDFYTNSLDEIPARYLKQARVLDVATGKKGALATARPAAAPGTATAGIAGAPGGATAPGSAALAPQVGAPVPQGTAPGPGTSTAAATPVTAPEPVASRTTPSSTVPPQITKPRYRSGERRIERRSRRRAYEVEEE